MKNLIIAIFIICSGFITKSALAQHSFGLEDYIKIALTNSPLLNEYNQQVYVLKLDSLKLLANYGFVVTGEGTASVAPTYKGWGYENALSNGHPVTAMLKASKEFVSKKNLDARLASFYLSATQIKNQAALSTIQLKKNITDLYTASFISQQQFKAIQDISKLFDQEDIVLKKLTQAAVFKQTDYLSFKVTKQQNELALEQKQTEWYNNFALLNYAAGMMDTIPKLLPPPVIQYGNIRPFEESIYVQAYKTDSIKFANDALLIDYEYKPKIGAYVDAGYQSIIVQTPYKNFGWSAGIALSIPIYDGKKKQISLQQNRIAAQSRAKYLDFARVQYNQQIAQVQSQINQYQKMSAKAQEQLEYAQVLIEANAKQLPTGDVKVVDFILAITNYYNLRVGIIQYQGNILSLQNQLNYLTLP